MKSRTMRVIVPVLAAILVVAASAAILALRTGSATARPIARATATPAARWTTFRDPLGLYTIQYPVGWTVSGGVSTGGEIIFPTFTIHLAGVSDGYDFTETAHPMITIHIGAIKITTPDVRDYYCHPDPNADTTFDGVPASHIGAVYVFDTGNAHFQIHEGPPHPGSEPIIQGTPPARVPASTIQAEQATYNSILATFQSLAPKGSTC